jgi:hypothetical protein
MFVSPVATGCWPITGITSVNVTEAQMAFFENEFASAGLSLCFRMKVLTSTQV